MKKWKFKTDTKMHSYGDIDEKKKIIRLNPKKGDEINTALHEFLHRKYPQKPEKWIRARAKSLQKTLSLKEKIKLLQRFV